MRSTGYVVIELKTGKFQPEYAGKLNFYVALVDDVLLARAGDVCLSTKPARAVARNTAGAVCRGADQVCRSSTRPR